MYGANIGAEDLTAPYSIAWNTTQTANGSHTLTAVARDAAGNVQIGRDDFAGLPLLMGIGDVSAIHGCARGADRSTEHIRQFCDERKALLGAPELGLLFVESGWRLQRWIIRNPASA